MSILGQDVLPFGIKIIVVEPGYKVVDPATGQSMTATGCNSVGLGDSIYLVKEHYEAIKALF